MNVSKKMLGFVMLAGLAPASGLAAIMDIDFRNMSGNYDGASSYAAIVRAGGPGVGTDGIVARVIPAFGQADYDNGANGGTGWVGNILSGFADFVINLSVDNLTANSADGTGTWSVTDVQGDTISGTVTGTWFRVGNDAHFGGVVTAIVTNNSADGTFDGPTGGSFSMNFGQLMQPFTGSLFNITSQGWFSLGTSYRNRLTDAGVKVSVVPEPAAAALGLIGLAMIRRWSRSA